MENIHKRTLRAVYNEYEKNYTDLLADHDEISIHQMHLQFLAIEVFKSANKLNPQFMWCFFENHEIPSNLRCASVVKLPGTNNNKIWNKFTKLEGCNVVEFNTKNYKTYQDVTRI